MKTGVRCGEEVGTEVRCDVGEGGDRCGVGVGGDRWRMGWGSGDRGEV